MICHEKCRNNEIVEPTKKKNRRFWHAVSRFIFSKMKNYVFVDFHLHIYIHHIKVLVRGCPLIVKRLHLGGRVMTFFFDDDVWGGGKNQM